MRYLSVSTIKLATLKAIKSMSHAVLSVSLLGAAGVIGSAAISTSVQAASASSDDVIGEWRLISRDYGTVRAILEAKRDKKGKYYIRIKKLLDNPDKRVRCNSCPDPFTDKRIEGMVIIWGIEPSSDNPHRFDKGYGIDPWKGTVFRGKMELVDEDRLKVVANPVEMPFLKRQFEWLRVK